MRILQGCESRCWCSSSKPRCYRSCRTARGSGSGCSCHRHATQHQRNCSCSDRPQYKSQKRRLYWYGNPKITFYSIKLEEMRESKLSLLATPIHPLMVIFGGESRCWCSSTKPRCYRTGRTARGAGSGCSSHRHTTQHQKRNSCSDRPRMSSN